jgi:hypothetical protein
MLMAPYVAFVRPLPARAVFLARLACNFMIGGGIIACCLGIGVLGYHDLAGLSWLDALLNSAMILTGMGPVNVVTTPGGKLFATFYALFSGIAFVSIVAVLFAPVAQRLLHRFHLEFSGEEPTDTLNPVPPERSASGR